MKYLVRIWGDYDLEEIFDNEDDALDFICEETFGLYKEDPTMCSNIKKLRTKGTYSDCCSSMEIRQVDDAMVKLQSRKEKAKQKLEEICNEIDNLANQSKLGLQ